MQKNEISKDSKIKIISMHDEMSSSYLSYAMSVIVSRALPDIRDGLKPVHRRILFAMHKGGYDWSKQFRKSARIVGDVIGKYHPHGDQSVYDALVRMVQDFSMSLPLIEGQLSTRKWKDEQSGQDKYSTEIIIQGYNSSLTMLGGGGRGIQNDNSSETISKNSDEPSQMEQNDLDDEIPF